MAGTTLFKARQQAPGHAAQEPASETGLTLPVPATTNRNVHPTEGEGTRLSFNNLFSLKRGPEGTKIEITELALKVTEREWAEARDQCLCHARARGDSARIDVSVFAGEVSSHAISALAAIAIQAKSIGLELTFDNVPEAILKKMDFLRIPENSGLRFKVGTGLLTRPLEVPLKAEAA